MKNVQFEQFDAAAVECLTGADCAADSVRLRLTSRGKVVVSVLAAVLLSALLVVGVNLTGAQAESNVKEASQQFEYVVMQPGGSLWDVATRLDAQSDPRDLVAEIVQLNQLSGADVQAGQPVAVPLRYNGASWLQTADELGL